MKTKLRDVQNIVEDILVNSNQARSSDKRLLVEFWQRQGMHLSRAQVETFAKLPAPETLTRCRRKLQENGKYPAVQQIQYERFQQQHFIQEELREW